MRRILLALSLALPFAATASNNDIDKVNGSVHVDAGQQAGDVSTVNGAVHVASGASVHKASTVNGAIDLGEKAQASEVGTVNGGISLGAGSHVSGAVDATNGGIRLEQAADVGGRLSNVNGGINLTAAHVAGGIGTINGDITIGADSRVEGGILVDKPSGWFNSSSSRPPHVVIGPHAIVQGTLEFRRDVVLQVSDSAQIGAVKGATPLKFSGVAPAN